MTSEEPEAMGPDEHYREAVDYLNAAANEPHVRDDLAQLAWLHFRAAEVGLALEASAPGFAVPEKTPKAGCTCGDPGYCRCTHLEKPPTQTVGTGKIMVGPAPGKAWATFEYGKDANPTVVSDGNICRVEYGAGTALAGHRLDGKLVRLTLPRPAKEAPANRTEADDDARLRETLEAAASDGKARCRAYPPTMTGLRCDIPEGHTCDHEAWLSDGAERIAW